MTTLKNLKGSHQQLEDSNARCTTDSDNTDEVLLGALGLVGLIALKLLSWKHVRTQKSASQFRVLAIRRMGAGLLVPTFACRHSWDGQLRTISNCRHENTGCMTTLLLQGGISVRSSLSLNYELCDSQLYSWRLHATCCLTYKSRYWPQLACSGLRLLHY